MTGCGHFFLLDADHKRRSNPNGDSILNLLSALSLHSSYTGWGLCIPPLKSPASQGEPPVPTSPHLFELHFGPLSLALPTSSGLTLPNPSKAWTEATWDIHLNFADYIDTTFTSPKAFTLLSSSHASHSKAAILPSLLHLQDLLMLYFTFSAHLSIPLILQDSAH